MATTKAYSTQLIAGYVLAIQFAKVQETMIEDNIFVIGVLIQPELYEKTISNMVECKSWGAYLMGLTFCVFLGGILL